VRSDGSVRRIPALDGLRAVSIALVLLAHLAGTRHFLALSALSRFGDIGNLGVSVFFVISGYLITTLLLRDHTTNGRIDLLGFYRRRACRILPAAGVYLLVLAVAAVTTGSSLLSSSDWLHALTFTMNYHLDRAWCVGHLWSLSVEEQFYLLWPAAMRVLGPRRSLKLAGSAIAVAPVWRVCVWLLWPQARDGIGETFPTVMDGIAIGCVLAGSANWLTRRVRYQRFLVSPLFLVTPLLVLLCNAFDHYPSFYFTFGMTARNVAIAAIVHWAILRANHVAAAVLDAPGLKYLGRMSYSLYLWQQPFLDRHGTLLLATFPANIAAALGCALLSNTFVECPTHPEPDLRRRPGLRVPVPRRRGEWHHRPTLFRPGAVK
jgi:peptidoglycan/LPS O-acetylase OafA/YrhL